MSQTNSTRWPPADVLMDSTLRDGEQAPGVMISPEEKASYVELAEAAGVRYLEIGFPHNPFDFAACKPAALAAKKSRLVAMALTRRESIDKVVAVGAHEVLFIVPCSESHLAAIFGGTIHELPAQLMESITQAHEKGLAINIGLEDASQGDLHVIQSLLDEVRRLGISIDCITIADTRGQLIPSETERLIRVIKDRLQGMSCRSAAVANQPAVPASKSASSGPAKQVGVLRGRGRGEQRDAADRGGDAGERATRAHVSERFPAAASSAPAAMRAYAAVTAQ